MQPILVNIQIPPGLSDEPSRLRCGVLPAILLQWASAEADPPSGDYPAATAAVRAVLIAPMAVVIAVERGPVVPNATDTNAMIQAATIRYSNDTTPSLSARRRLSASVLLTQYFNIG